MSSELSSPVAPRVLDPRVGHSTSVPVEVARASVAFFTKRRPLNAFGFGGLHLRAGPNSTVTIARVSECFRSAPVMTQLTTFHPTADLDAFIARRIDACESASDSLLWSAVRVRRAHGASINTALFAQSARVPGSPEHALVTMLAQGRATTGYAAPSYLGVQIVDSKLEELQQILGEGGPAAALSFAIESELWPFALVLAQTVSAGEARRVAGLFIAKCVSPSPLATQLRAIAADPGDGGEGWEAILETNLRTMGVANICKLAEVLEARGMVAQAHTCRVLASESLQEPPGRFALVGADWRRPTVTAVQMSQLVAKTPPRGFFPYYLYYTMALADFGLTDQALENCAKLVELFAREKLGVLQHVANVIRQKLEKISARKGPGEGIVKIIFGAVDKAITSLVHGTEEHPAEMRARVLPEAVSTEAPHPAEEVQPEGEKPKPAKQGAAPQEEKSQPKSGGGWFGSLASKLNPFRKGTVVELSQHDNEMYWNGSRYVLRGHENDEPEPAPPPPPPAAAKPKPPAPPDPGEAGGQTEGGGAPPPPAGAMRTGAKARAVGRYVSSF
jgi:hypothetical protein